MEPVHNYPGAGTQDSQFRALPAVPLSLRVKTAFVLHHRSAAVQF